MAKVTKKKKTGKKQFRKFELADVQKAREKRGYTLRDLEQFVDVSRQALSAYEHGQYPPRAEIWEQLKGILGLSGTVADYWGRAAHVGKARLYGERDLCYHGNCKLKAVSKGLCRKHYQRRRYNQLMHGEDEEVREAC